MKILVAIKRVVDAYVRVRVKSDGTGVDLTNAKMAINPFFWARFHQHKILSHGVIRQGGRPIYSLS